MFNNLCGWCRTEVEYTGVVKDGFRQCRVTYYQWANGREHVLRVTVEWECGDEDEERGA